MRPRVPPAVAALTGFLLVGAVLLWPALTGERVLSASRGWLAGGPFSAELRCRTPAEGHVQSDQALQFAPWLRYAATAWAIDGRLPLWKSTANCGAPLLGNAQSALLFPPNLLAIALGAPDWTWAALALLKLAGGMLCAWLLGRHLGLSPLSAAVCGLAFGLGGFQAAWILHPLTNVSCLFPLLVLLADRVAARGGGRALAGLGLVAGLQHLGGHPETAFHCQVAALGVGAARAWSLRAAPGGQAEGPGPGIWRRVAAVAAGLALGALIGAIQILPTIEYILHSDALALRLGEQGSAALEYPAATLAFLAALVAAGLALLRLSRAGNPLPAAAALFAAVLAGVLAQMSITWDSAQLLPFASDWLGGPVSYLGPPNYIERNGAYAGAALALAAVGLLAGRPRGVSRVAGVFALVGLLAGFKAPLLDDLLDVLPGFHLAANLRLQLWTLLALAVLAGQGFDALGRIRDPGADRERGRVRATPVDALRAPLLLAALAAACWIAGGVGLRFGWYELPANPSVPAADVVVKAALGPRGDLAALAPALAQQVERLGIASLESRPQGVVGWSWSPPVSGDARLEFAPGGSSPALLVAHDEPAPSGPVALRRYSFAAVIPAEALGSGHVRASLVLPLADGRTAVSEVLSPENDPDDEALPIPLRPARGAGGGQLLLLGAAAALAAAGRLARGATLGVVKLALVATILATLLPFTSGLLPMIAPELYYPRTGDLDRLASLAPDARVFSLVPGRFPREVATWYGIPDVAGYDALAPAHVAVLLRAAADWPEGRAPVDVLPTRPDLDRGLLGLAAVALLLDVPGVRSPLGAQRNPGYLPRARLATGVLVEPDDATALVTLARPEFPRETTVVLGAGEPRPGRPGAGPPPRIVVDRPDRVVVEVEPALPALLVLADTDFPGWSARVDGESRPILRADVAFRAVEVRPGERAVEFRYEPLSVSLGALLTLLGGLACALLLLRR